jgi:dTDP-4-amino-4,6-dideoxygalactose transaminase
VKNDIRSCEQMLAKHFGRKHCILSGRAATALWMCYSVLSSKRLKVLLPSMICLSPVFTVMLAGRMPIFADVHDSNATIDPAIVEKMIADDPEIGAVVAVHLYGHQAKMEKLKDICSKYDVILIEDVAQALGGKTKNGQLFGTFGDISVLSFGHTKILDLGGGGALLTDSNKKNDFFRALNNQVIEEDENKIKRLSKLYSKLYYSIMEGVRIDPEFIDIMKHFPKLFRSIYFRKVSSELAQRIDKGFLNLPNEIFHRQKISACYDEYLGDIDGLSFFQKGKDEVPWRYTFRVTTGNREKVLNNIRNQGFDASNWYPSVSEWFTAGQKHGKDKFANSLRFQDEVVNLWVSKEYTSNSVFKLSKIISESIKG